MLIDSLLFLLELQHLNATAFLLPADDQRHDQPSEQWIKLSTIEIIPIPLAKIYVSQRLIKHLGLELKVHEPEPIEVVNLIELLPAWANHMVSNLDTLVEVSMSVLHSEFLEGLIVCKYFD